MFIHKLGKRAAAVSIPVLACPALKVSLRILRGIPSADTVFDCPIDCPVCGWDSEHLHLFELILDRGVISAHCGRRGDLSHP